MRKNLVIASTLIALVVLSGCLQAGPGNDGILAEKPTWEPGYFWEWKLLPDSDNPGATTIVNQTLLRSITLPVYRGPERTGWLAIWNSDGGHAPDSEFFDPNHLGNQGLGAMNSDNGCIQYYLRGNTSPPFLEFPLVAGKKWNGTERLLQAVDSRKGLYHEEGKVVGRESITVQGTRYDDAVRIEFRYWITAEENGDVASPPGHPFYAQPTVMYYSPTARHVVKLHIPTGEIRDFGLPGMRLTGRMWDSDTPIGDGTPGTTLELTRAEFTPKPPTDILQETRIFSADYTYCEYNLEHGK